MNLPSKPSRLWLGIALSLALCCSVFAEGNPPAQVAIDLKKTKIDLPKKLEIPQKSAEELFREKVIASCEFKLKTIEPQVEVKPPKVGLKGVGKPEVNILFKVLMDVTNNSDLELQTGKIDVILFADGKPIPPDVKEPTATGVIPEPQKFPIGQTVTLPADLKVPPEKATLDLANLIKSDTVHYRVDGVFYFKYLDKEIDIRAMLVEAEKEKK